MNDNFSNNELDFDENGTTVLSEEDINFARGNNPNQTQTPQTQQPQNDPYSNPEYSGQNVGAQQSAQPQQNNQQQMPQQNVQPQQQMPQPPKNTQGKKSKKWLIPVIIGAVVIVLGVVGFFCLYFIPNSIKYNKAEAEYKDQKYSEAIDDFKNIEGFRDSKEKLYQCHKMFGDELDLAGDHKLAKKQYDESIKYAQTDEEKKTAKKKAKTQEHKIMFKDAYDSCQGSSCVQLLVSGLILEVNIPVDKAKWVEGIACFALVEKKLGTANNYSGNVFDEAQASFSLGQEYNKKIGDIAIHGTNSSISGKTFTFTAE